MAIMITGAPRMEQPKERQPDKIVGASAPAPAAKVAEPEATEPQEEMLSPKFAALARKEKAIRSKQQELKAKEEALKAREAEYTSNYVPKSELKARIEKDPLGFFSEHGGSYDQLTQSLLNQPGPQDQALQKLQAEIEALKAAKDQSETKQQEQQKQAYEQAVNQIRNETKILIDSDPLFETIKETGNAEAVVELIKETFDADGTLLSVEEAAKEVENYLVEQAMKMAQLRKVKERLSPAPQVESPQQSAPNKQSQTMKTLTHAQNATSKPLSEKERRQRAILAFKGQL